MFIVWEPILLSDVAPPTSGDLARCHDRRARQFWDEGGLVSKVLRDPHGPERGGVVWDYVAVYAPDATWDASLPPPQFEGRPVVNVQEELRARLAARGP